MARSTDKTYTEVVTVALSPGQKTRLDSQVTAGMNRSDIIRAALDAYPREAISHSASSGIDDGTVARIADAVAARIGPAPTSAPAKPGKLASPDEMKAVAQRLSRGAPGEPEVPEGWALAGIDVDALRALQEASAPALSTALAVVLRAAESGELDRADVARIVAARWGMHDGDRLHFDGGQLYREPAPAPKRRSVAHRAG